MKGIRMAGREELGTHLKTWYVSDVNVWKPQFTGMWAWWLHRITGLAVTGFLLLHVLGFFLLSESSGSREHLGMYIAEDLSQEVLAAILEMGLLAAVLVHAINGIRLLLLDLGIGYRRQRETFWFGMAAAVVIFALTVTLLPGVFK